ncbi:MAG TPA: putative sulfate exporter family transporter [Gemmataceae bacterium]|jgi:uncharacterized integral membrane protein (TIGR00698 family)|nr:putative sulfate exporter family transporter [Gemmataceae bacterium]
MGRTATPAIPDWAQWLDSMEGVPEYVPVRKPPTGVHPRVAHYFERVGELAPGVVLALGLAFAGERFATWLGTAVLGFEHSPIGAVPVAVLLGLLVRNVIGLPRIYEPGLKLCVRTLLRAGIVLLGLKLSLTVAWKVGLVAFPVIVLCIITALVAAKWLGRVLKLPRRLTILIAVGTSICGVSAIGATAAVIEAEDDEVSYAVACVTVFGLLALLGYPFFAFVACAGNESAAGIFLGTAIHDTAQVAGAGLIYQQQFDATQAPIAAMVTKLMRNTFMAAVIPLMAVVYFRTGPKTKGRVSWTQALPLFVPAFLVAACIRSAGDVGDRPFGILTKDNWADVLKAGEWLSNKCLALAMVAVGLGTGLANVRKLGLRPLMVGLATAVAVGALSLGLVTAARVLGWV